MKVLAAWSLWPDPPAVPGDDLRVADLAPLEAQFVAQRPRRMGKHARLALLGASACVKSAAVALVPDRTGIYLGSGIGNAAEEYPVVEQAVGMAMGLRPGPASPVHFANSVSNSATFHVARATGATGPNLVLSQEEVSFEGALMVADLALRAGEVDLALVGGVDECLAAREGVWRRLDLPESTVLGEGTGWLLVGRDDAGDAGDAGVLGEILSSRQVPCPAGAGPAVDTALDRLADDLSAARRPGERVRILPGIGLSPGDALALAARIPGAGLAPYLTRSGTFATAAALGVAALFAPGTAAGLHLHVARSRLGLATVLLRRFE